MRRLFLFFIMVFSVNFAYSYTGIYLGWQNFVSPVINIETKANVLNVGIIGTTPTRFYFYHNILGQVVFTEDSKGIGQLGWGLDIAAGVGYRFLSTSYKRSGWDLGMDLFGYFNPYFLNSETKYTETALYYGVGLGLITKYKFNPYIGLGFRATLRYNIGTKYLASEAPSVNGIIFSVGSFISF